MDIDQRQSADAGRGQKPAPLAASDGPWGRLATPARTVAVGEVAGQGERAWHDPELPPSYFQMVVETSVVGMFRTSLDGRFLAVNPGFARILGYQSPEALMAAVPRTPALYEDPAQRAALVAQVQDQGEIDGFEARFRRADGGLASVLISVRTIHDVGGSFLGLGGVVVDITQQKRTEEALREAERALERSNAELEARVADQTRELRESLGRLREAEGRQRLMHARLVAAQEEERRRISIEVHDDTVQAISAVAMRLDMLAIRRPELAADEGFTRLASAARGAIARLRHLMFELRPPTLDREGLAAALSEYCRAQETSEEAPAYHLRNRLAREPSPQARIVAYRIAQEALTNVRRHARASSVEITLENRDGVTLVRVADDGIGFAAGTHPSSPVGHLGLDGMRERAGLAGGWVRVTSEPGHGTVVEILVPDPPAEPGQVEP